MEHPVGQLIGLSHALHIIDDGIRQQGPVVDDRSVAYQTKDIVVFAYDFCRLQSLFLQVFNQP